MVELATASIILLLFIGCNAVGTLLHDRMLDHHRSKETFESVRLIVTIVVTFSALTLSLLVTSAKVSFDDETDLYKRYGIALSEFNWRLHEYGSQVDPVHRFLRSFTAATFAQTWPGERAPSGDYPRASKPAASERAEDPAIAALLVRMDDILEKLAPTDAYHQRIAAKLQDQVHELEDYQWRVLEQASSRISSVFFGLLITWLSITFFTFGLVSPNSKMVHLTVFLAAFSVATSLYLVLDLDTPLSGFIAVPSQPFRDALWHMDHGTGL